MVSRWDRVKLPEQTFTFNAGGASLPARSQMWREMMRARSLNVERGSSDEIVHGAIAGQTFSGGILSRWTFSNQSLVLTPAAARRLDDEYVFISVTLEGEGAHVVGDEVSRLGPGDFIVVDAKQAFSSAVTSASGTKGFLHIRKSALRDRLGGRHEAAIGVYKAGPPLQRLAFNYLRSLSGLIGQADATTLTTFAGQALDIIALLVNERQPGVVEQMTHRSAMLFRLKADIKANLRNPGYSPDAAAAALGTTPRNISALLAREGTSFGRLLLEQRLMASRRDLTNPRNVHRQVAEIAFDWGFNNLSHFSRVFKNRFGMTPREVKSIGMAAAIRTAA